MRNLKEHKDMQNVLTAGNWNQPEDDFTEMFMLQNLRQFWLPEEISLSNDVLTWEYLTEKEKDTYEKNLARLTLLDTIQGDVGMNRIARFVPTHHQKAVLSFMGAMENAVHARSYSNIFLTLSPSSRINELFRWVESSYFVQKNARIINEQYEAIKGYDETLYKAMVASVALESFLFYSGFYYPLYMAGQGKLIGSGEIINLIIRDEAIHGVYVGLLSQELLQTFDEETQKNLKQFVLDFFERLLENEVKYTKELYEDLGLFDDVMNFVKYNANKAMNNLGLEAHYKHEAVNPIVLNGLKTNSKSHDFFSTKGNSYKKAIVEPIRDSDFYFDESY